jgi:tRNA A58 N-methylase Trm61|tara:strand:+ start:2054 stop:2638 length:585 start_codon:yes stop_codon:yes gene_type:complete
MKKLLDHLHKYGNVYNTEDSALFFYALTKMQQYSLFVEFGTGLACTSLAVTTAMQENNKGSCITYDNGSHFKNVSDYKKFLNNLIKKHKLGNRMIIINEDINFNNIFLNQKADCVFSDFKRNKEYIEKLLKWSSKYVKHNGYIFIDGLKSYSPGFDKAKELIKKYNWSLTVIDKEDKQNIDQNNMCWIKVNSDV